ncbi:MAG: hypothetical protein KJ065_23595 [Anaerolineae bacterium]|nr:hypothetical protein [Anaerolineae bacterium]
MNLLKGALAQRLWQAGGYCSQKSPRIRAWPGSGGRWIWGVHFSPSGGNAPHQRFSAPQHHVKASALAQGSVVDDRYACPDPQCELFFVIVYGIDDCRMTPTRLELRRRSMPEIVQWLLLTSGLKTHGRKVSRDQLIRKRHAQGESLSNLARELGVSPQRIHQIIRDREQVHDQGNDPCEFK